MIDQPTLPFDGEDGRLVDGYTAVQKAKADLAARRAMTSGCTCGHQRAEHVGERLVCAARGCPCARFHR